MAVVTLLLIGLDHKVAPLIPKYEQ